MKLPLLLLIAFMLAPFSMGLESNGSVGGRISELVDHSETQQQEIAALDGEPRRALHHHHHNGKGKGKGGKGKGGKWSQQTRKNIEIRSELLRERNFILDSVKRLVLHAWYKL